MEKTFLSAPSANLWWIIPNKPTTWPQLAGGDYGTKMVAVPTFEPLKGFMLFEGFFVSALRNSQIFLSVLM